MTSLLAVAALAATPFIEPWGLSLEAKDGVVIISAVRPGSIAAGAKVVAGTRLVRIASTTPAISGVVGTLEAEDLPSAVAALSAVGLTAAVLEVPGRRFENLRFLDVTPPRIAQEAVFRASRVQSVAFDVGRLSRVVYLDPKSKAPLGVTAGTTSGSTVYARERLEFSCGASGAQRATLRGPSLATPQVVDLTSTKLHGGSVEVYVPLAKLAALTACPAQPLIIPMELELQCFEGLPVLGRERWRLSVKCERPTELVADAFEVTKPVVMKSTVTVGTPRLEVRPPRADGDSAPISAGVVLIDAAGKEVLRADALWQRQPRVPAEWKQLEIAAPRAPGEYALHYEAAFADGSKARSSAAQVTVITAEQDAAQDQAIRDRFAAHERLTQRLKDAKIDLCDARVAIPWLRKQPEVESVWDGDGTDYSFQVKNFPAPMLVHCH